MDGTHGRAACGPVVVASLTQARKHHRRHGAVLTLHDPGMRPRIRPEGSWLRLSFEDLDDAHPGLWVATAGDVAAILAFGREHAALSILAHCQAGVGRSPAAALAILADRMGPGREADALASLLAQRPESCPNRLVARLADAALGRGGALMSALDAWEASEPRVARLRAARLRAFREGPGGYARKRA